MDTNKRHFLFRFFEWDLTAIIAGSVALALIVGFGFASVQPVVKFDYQGAAIDDISSNSTPVMGSLDLFPEEGPSGIVYGWTNSSLQEYSDQGVADKLQRDSNSSTQSNTFKIAGLIPQKYTFRFTVGSSDIPMSTKVIFGPQVTTSIVTEQNEWVTKDVVYEVSEGDDPLTLDFSSNDGSTSWGIAGLAVYATDQPITPASFDLTVSPGSVSITAGGSVSIVVGVTPDEDYAYSVDFSVSDIPAGMQTEYIPTNLKLPPGSTTLTISLSQDISPTSYSITIKATGGADDPEKVVRSTALNVTVLAKQDEDEEVTDEPGDVVQDGDTITKDELTDGARRVRESNEGFGLITDYLKNVEDEEIFIVAEIAEIDRMTRGIGAFLDIGLPPAPTSSIESALQALTALGIIDSVVSSAPPGPRAPDTAPNIWQRFLGAILNPAG